MAEPPGDGGENRIPRAKAGKVMLTFRLPRPLVQELKGEAARGRRDLTAHVTRLIEGIQWDFELPAVARELLVEDRGALGMEPYEYFQHLLYERGLKLREKGAGFDAPRGPFARRR